MIRFAGTIHLTVILRRCDFAPIFISGFMELAVFYSQRRMGAKGDINKIVLVTCQPDFLLRLLIRPDIGLFSFIR